MRKHKGVEYRELFHSHIIIISLSSLVCTNYMYVPYLPYLYAINITLRLYLFSWFLFFVSRFYSFITIIIIMTQLKLYC